MSSYVLMFNGVVHSKPISLEEAQQRQADHSKWGVDYEIVAHGGKVEEVTKMDHGPAEVIEDVGCAGGACTL